MFAFESYQRLHIGTLMAAWPDLAPREGRGEEGRKGRGVRRPPGEHEISRSLAGVHGPSRWPSGKASASRAEDPRFESCLSRDFFGVESYQ